MAYEPDEDMRFVLEAVSYSRFRKTAIKNAKKIRSSNIQAGATRIKKSLVGEKNKCEICGFSFKPVLQIHHILPISEFGNNAEDNVICVCPNCHKSLHVLYKMFDKGKSKEEFHTIFNSYEMETVKTLMNVCTQYVIKRGEMLDFIENCGLNDSSEE